MEDVRAVWSWVCEKALFFETIEGLNKSQVIQRLAGPPSSYQHPRVAL
jgi:hypothetical protein